MTRDKFWMIVNVADAVDFKAGERIPTDNAPRYMHVLEDLAVVELLRLQERYPNGEFVLMEAMAMAVPKVKTVLVVEPLGDGIPF